MQHIHYTPKSKKNTDTHLTDDKLKTKSNTYTTHIRVKKKHTLIHTSEMKSV